MRGLVHLATALILTTSALGAIAETGEHEITLDPEQGLLGPFEPVFLDDPRFPLYPQSPPPADPMCGSCDYNLTGNVSGICPECGWKLTRKVKRRVRLKMRLEQRQAKRKAKKRFTADS